MSALLSKYDKAGVIQRLRSNQSYQMSPSQEDSVIQRLRSKQSNQMSPSQEEEQQRFPLLDSARCAAGNNGFSLWFVFTASFQLHHWMLSSTHSLSYFMKGVKDLLMVKTFSDWCRDGGSTDEMYFWYWGMHFSQSVLKSTRSFLAALTSKIWHAILAESQGSISLDKMDII